MKNSIKNKIAFITALVTLLTFVTITVPLSIAAKDKDGNTIITEITAATFPDPIFRRYILEVVDLNTDSKLSDFEIGKVTGLMLSERGISDLTGIEYFTNLTNLDVSKNRLTKISNLSDFKLKNFKGAEQTIDLYFNDVSNSEYRSILDWDTFKGNGADELTLATYENFDSVEYKFTESSSAEFSKILTSPARGTSPAGNFVLYENNIANSLYMTAKDKSVPNLYYKASSGTYSENSSGVRTQHYLTGTINIKYSTTSLSFNAHGGVIEYHILIPKELEVTGERKNDKFAIAVNTNENFFIESDHVVQVQASTAKGYLINGDDSIPFTLVKDATSTEQIKNNPIVKFNSKTAAPKDVYVNFDANAAKYTGKYTAHINFNVYYVVGTVSEA
jgi:hypothetical protein